MAANDENNNAVYLILGGLFAVALVFGSVLWGRYYNNPANIEPAAGTASYSSSTTINEAPPAPERDMQTSPSAAPALPGPANDMQSSPPQ